MRLLPGNPPAAQSSCPSATANIAPRSVIGVRCHQIRNGPFCTLQAVDTEDAEADQAVTCVCLTAVVVTGCNRMSMQALGLERWARPAGGLSGLGAGASCTEAAPPRRHDGWRAAPEAPVRAPMGDGTTRQRHLSCSSPKSSAGRPSPAPTLHRKTAGGHPVPASGRLGSAGDNVVMRAPEHRRRRTR